MTAGGVRLVEVGASDARPLVAPFNEQTALDVASGARTAFRLFGTQVDEPVGSAVLGGGELDLFIAPDFRARGFGRSAAAALLERAGDGPLRAWSHGDDPAARAIAARFGFEAVRVLLQMRMPIGEEPRSGVSTRSGAAAITAFRPGIDEDEWLALNARVFAWHPEQGGTTRDDLAARMAEPWFDADDFLVARDADGTMLGYNWLKAQPGAPGEIYVIGVAPEAAGQGLGRELMLAGLARLRERGYDEAELYTEADNEPAVKLYRSLGFTDAARDVQYANAAARS